MQGDLHSHTTFSDGSLEIEQLPPLASAAGLTHLAVSDHDSVQAVAFAQQHPQCSGVRLIPATELTCFDTARGRRVHMLCYFPHITRALQEFCALMAQRRNTCNRQSMQLLQEMYPQFSPQAALGYVQRSGVLYKTQLMRVLLDFGYTNAIYGDLYKELFGFGTGKVLREPQYEPVETVLNIIHEARGIAVLAHPSVYNSMELAAELTQSGQIDGVEIEHPRNTPQDKQSLYALAEQYGLIVTGGTDFHGFYTSHPAPLGTCRTNDENLQRLLALAAQRGNEV